jgi:hypothetical protein
MYLGGTVYRIYGTNAPETIGTHVSSGGSACPEPLLVRCRFCVHSSHVLAAGLAQPALAL